MFELINESTRKPVKVGDVVATFRGEVVIVKALRPPHKPDSSGHVSIQGPDDNYCQEVYAGVIGAKYITR